MCMDGLISFAYSMTGKISIDGREKAEGLGPQTLAITQLVRLIQSGNWKLIGTLAQAVRLIRTTQVVTMCSTLPLRRNEEMFLDCRTSCMERSTS